MPKLKSHRGAKKRFKVTKTGRIKHRSAMRGHHFTCKPQKRKRQARMMRTLAPGDENHVTRMLHGS